MRLLVTIPHYFRRTPEGYTFYGSESGDIDARSRMVERCIASIHQAFGSRHVLLGPTMVPCNTAHSAQIDVVVITSVNQHLAERLPRHLFNHYATRVDPRHLGFVCHEFLREHAGRYDWYVFLEDDIELTDPLLFDKLTWFNGLFGDQALLQPNRYELSSELNVVKMYVDGETIAPELSRQYQDTAIRPRLQADAFGRPVLFQRVNNVHAGCFFLNAAQLAHIAAQPSFGVPSSEFFGPLESAVTLPVMRAFDVYKPARENAAFLEVHHLGLRFLRAGRGKPPNPPPGPAPIPGPDTTPP